MTFRPKLRVHIVTFNHARFIGQALDSPHRLELLDLLGQGERSVYQLAQEIGQSLANTSAHL